MAFLWIQLSAWGVLWGLSTLAIQNVSICSAVWPSKSLFSLPLHSSHHLPPQCGFFLHTHSFVDGQRLRRPRMQIPEFPFWCTSLLSGTLIHNFQCYDGPKPRSPPLQFNTSVFSWASPSRTVDHKAPSGGRPEKLWHLSHEFIFSQAS